MRQNSSWHCTHTPYIAVTDIHAVMVYIHRKQNDHMNQMRQDAVELMEAREVSLMYMHLSFFDQ